MIGLNVFSDTILLPEMTGLQVFYRVTSPWSDGVYHFYFRILPVGDISYTANGTDLLLFTFWLHESVKLTSS